MAGGRKGCEAVKQSEVPKLGHRTVPRQVSQPHQPQQSALQASFACLCFVFGLVIACVLRLSRGLYLQLPRLSSPGPVWQIPSVLSWSPRVTFGRLCPPSRCLQVS